MPKAFFLSIVTPDKVFFEGEIDYLSVPGGAGYMGVLADHAPLISSLSPGNFMVSPAGSVRPPVNFTTERAGLLEVQNNKASILLDSHDSAALAVAVTKK